MKPNLPN